MVRVLLAGTISVGVFALFAVTVWLSLPPGRETVRDDAAAEPSHVADRFPQESEDWVVTTATSAHNALVINVNALHLEHSLDIATAIVEPVKGKYEEILIYVHPPGGFSDGPMRRVQWTPAGGYVETVFSLTP